MTCESCGADADELTRVHRKYVIAGDWALGRTERVLPDVEHWCFSCSTQYPHEPAHA